MTGTFAILSIVSIYATFAAAQNGVPFFTQGALSLDTSDARDAAVSSLAAIEVSLA